MTDEMSRDELKDRCVSAEGLPLSDGCRIQRAVLRLLDDYSALSARHERARMDWIAERLYRIEYGALSDTFRLWWFDENEDERKTHISCADQKEGLRDAVDAAMKEES